MSKTDYDPSNDPRRNQLKTRFGPGFWQDQAGNLHVSINELLEVGNLEDTPENREQVVAMAMQVIRDTQPNAQVRYRNSPDE